jgi:hypothetical protein
MVLAASAHIVYGNMPLFTTILFGLMSSVSGALLYGVPAGALTGAVAAVARRPTTDTNRRILWFAVAVAAQLGVRAAQGAFLFVGGEPGAESKSTFAALTVISGLVAGVVAGWIGARLESRWAGPASDDTDVAGGATSGSVRHGAVWGLVLGTVTAALLIGPVWLFFGYMGGGADGGIVDHVVFLAPTVLVVAVLVGGLPGALIGSIWRRKR